MMTAELALFWYVVVTLPTAVMAGVLALVTITNLQKYYDKYATRH